MRREHAWSKIARNHFRANLKRGVNVTTLRTQLCRHTNGLSKARRVLLKTQLLRKAKRPHNLDACPGVSLSSAKTVFKSSIHRCRFMGDKRQKESSPSSVISTPRTTTQEPTSALSGSRSQPSKSVTTRLNKSPIQSAADYPELRMTARATQNASSTYKNMRNPKIEVIIDCTALAARYHATTPPRLPKTWDHNGTARNWSRHGSYTSAQHIHK